MEIELYTDGTKALVDPRGAWLTNLSDEKGDILFPKRTLKTPEGDEKVRGGCHVALPNFGPGGESGQPQHGFGRKVLWEVTDKTESSVLLSLDGDRDGYADLGAVLAYQLGENKALMTLEVVNNGKQPLRIAPAFHPYFALLSGSDVSIDGEPERLDELGEAQFFEGVTHELDLPNRHITVTSDAMPTWAKWTDQLGAYICIEPSQSGFSFLEATPGQDEMLGASETKTYALTIEW